MPPPRSDIGPIILSNAADSFIDPCRIIAIVWEGVTASGDTVILRARSNDAILWKGRTNTTQTYQGINLGPHGEHCPNGFYLSQISSGTLLVYLNQA